MADPTMRTVTGAEAAAARTAGRSHAATITSPSQFDKHQQRWGATLTPQIVTSILRRGDDGYLDRLADVLDEIRETDPHLQSVLFKREAQVAGAPWELRPSKRGGKRGQKIADFVTEALREMGGFAALLAHLQSGVYHGRAAAELIWEQDGRRWLPRRADPVHPRRLAYAALNWKLHVWDQNAPGTRFTQFPGVPIDDPAVFPRGKLVVHTPRVRGGYPTREGLGRVLIWYSIFKRWTQRDWMALAELVGRPGRVGYYSTGKDDSPEATPADKDALRDALNGWSSAVAITLPDTVKVDFQYATQGTGEAHDKLIAHCDSQMSKATLGGTLTTDAGARGARSLGDTQRNEQLMIAAWDAKALAETLYRDLLCPLVRFNFGDDAPVPQLVLQVEPNDDLDSLATRFKTLRDAGLDIPQKFVRTRMAIPEPEVGESLLGGAQMPDPDAPQPDPTAPQDGATEGEDDGAPPTRPGVKPTPTGAPPKGTSKPPFGR